ncbi:MogA/MoaB family molybdenum cofactor biosynthesis protein [Ornithinibacillus gellani]|uniref:MogA/MoaB family molybdenum cofactor biosynthesis protein n=1 Tax=Ornithinibacillus gellani TaxID=2293253 RepID=UPI000F4A6E94|nr:MogA/MoaB family molybdenum cofactor biosynthesis protein [Ornithinibacillus gellani]TQS76278.1 MogA/MoaB family molybdenum cofactor biosynthesis protein [Ornithinibacillus gellani]
MSYQTHKNKLDHVSCLVITVSDTRTVENDRSGQLMVSLLKKAGHTIYDKKIIPDEQEAIQQAIETGCQNSEIEVILTNGGTGVAKRDVTIETMRPLLDKEIPGFGELFRWLSYREDIGTGAIMSRAAAGVRDVTTIFSLPGSTGAVRLGMERLILPEITHIVYEAKKHLLN